ncbi:hypothetical protein GVAV_002852 [Gurleya vavrai]
MKNCENELDNNLNIKIELGENNLFNTIDIENNHTSSDIKKTIIELYSTLCKLNQKYEFFEKTINILENIGFYYRNNLMMTKEFIYAVKKIFLLKEEKHNNIITFYGFIVDDSEIKDHLIERKKERNYIRFIDFYIDLLLNNIQKSDIPKMIDETKNIELEKLENDFKEAFEVIFQLSKIIVDSYRENLSVKCLKILFNYSFLCKKMLIERIKEALKEYYKEVLIFKDLYPRIKRNEIYFILDRLIENKNIAKEVLTELVECLSCGDLCVVEKIKNCLKNAF